MDGQRARLVTHTLDRVPAIRRAVPVRAQPYRRLTRGWAAALGLGWPLAFVVSAAIEPAPADPQAAVPVVVALASSVLFLGLVATAVAAGIRHPSAAVGGIGVGLIAVASTVACPLSGHHTFGAWWFGQLGVMLAMLATSVAALGRHAYTES